MNRLLIITLFSFLFNCCCSQNKNDSKTFYSSNLETLKKEYPFINIQNAVLKQKNIMGVDSFYSYKSEILDTLVSFSFYKTGNKIRIDTYIKEYSDNYKYYNLLMDSDTVYFYKTDQRTGIKEFIIGEYPYKFMNGQLRIKEMDYYMLYKDSLDQIKGSNLPELPKLTEKEKILLKKKLEKL
jgi:hypothetical protein